MRLPLLLALSLAGAAPLAAPMVAHAADDASLTVTFTGLEAKGVVSFVLVNSAEAYGDKAAPVAADRLTVSGASVTRTFTGLAPGRYAIKAFHDVNADGKMATNPFGMPTEPYGFSNNAKASMGPPKWEDAGFAVASGANTQSIELK